uniref:Uncharacterized protein n=1 Tax=Salix viminalis TaxID=40686 RepID=A0A6N2MZG9_SALVM
MSIATMMMMMMMMMKEEEMVRYLTLLIIDELFMRSKIFRTLVVENLDQLWILSVGFRRNHPLPAPPAVRYAFKSGQCRQERWEREMWAKEILVNRFEVLKEEIPETVDGIGSV